MPKMIKQLLDLVKMMTDEDDVADAVEGETCPVPEYDG